MAGGVASEKSETQYASKDDEFNPKEKECEFLKEVPFCNPLKQGIWESQGACDIGVVSYKRGPWTKEEDAILRKVVELFGPNDWVKIETHSGLDRTSKSCRLRWKNHLQPHLKKGSFSSKEERDVIRMHYRYGNKWSLMAKRLPGRSDNEIKNLWHSRIKKCKKRGIPLYPEWCVEEDQTSNDDEVSRKSDGEKGVAAEALGEDQTTRSCSSYYSPSASTNEPLMTKAYPAIKSTETEFPFNIDQTALLHHEDSSFTQSTQPSHPQIFSSFQFLSPRPKTLLASSSTFSTSGSSTPHQQQYNKMENFNSAPTFDSFRYPPLISFPSGRFERYSGVILPPPMKPTEALYCNSELTRTPMSPFRLTMSSSNEAISDNNTRLLDALLQDGQVDSCLSDIQFAEQCLFSQQFNAPQNLYDKILRRKEHNSITEASLCRNLRTEGVPSNGSLLKSIGFVSKSQQLRESYQNKEFEGNGGSMRTQLLGSERLSTSVLKRKERMDFEHDKCHSGIPNIQTDQAPAEDLASYSFQFPSIDTTSETLSLDGICQSNLFHGH